MNFLSKLRLSFEGCMVVVMALAGVGFLAWGYVLDTFSAQAMSLLLCLVCFGAAVFIRALARRIDEDAELEAEAAAFVRASWLPETKDDADDDQPASSTVPKQSVIAALKQVFTPFADSFALGNEAAHHSA